MNGRFDILVVDDEPVLLSGVRRICGSEELTVDVASSTDEAIAKLTVNQYRLVLCDLMLPGIGGMHVLKTARKTHAQMPVVIITGYATFEHTRDCFRNGAFDVLAKPFDMPELLAVVHRALATADASSTSNEPELPVEKNTRR